MNVFYDKYKKYKSKYLKMKGGAAAPNFVSIKFNCIDKKQEYGMDRGKIKTLDDSGYIEYNCYDKIEVIVEYIEKQTGNPVKLIRNSHVLISPDKYKSDFYKMGMCNQLITINYSLESVYSITSEEQIQKIIKSMEFIRMFPKSVILLCPYASNVSENIDHNIKQGLNIDAILFAKKINKKLVIINMDLGFLSKSEKIQTQTTDYLNMDLLRSIKNEEIEINIYNNPKIKKEKLCDLYHDELKQLLGEDYIEKLKDIKIHELYHDKLKQLLGDDYIKILYNEKLYDQYYNKLTKHLGDDFITILNDIKLFVINFGINFIKQPDDITLTSIVETLSKQFGNHFICYKFFADNFPADLYINGRKKSQHIIYGIEKQKEELIKKQIKANARIELHQSAIRKIKDSNIIKAHNEAIHMIMMQLGNYRMIEEYEERIRILREQEEDSETYQQNIQIIKELEKDISRIKEDFPKMEEIHREEAIIIINKLKETINEIISKIKENHGEVNYIIRLRLETMNRIEELEKAINEIEETISKMSISN